MTAKVVAETEPIQILPIAEEHVAGFRRCLDAVARERRSLGFVQAPVI